MYNEHTSCLQGRITKVLNMKPPEILGMIEEAAGTRMFEHKKQNAQKTILKKQQKVIGRSHQQHLAIHDSQYLPGNSSSA